MITKVLTMTMKLATLSLFILSIFVMFNSCQDDNPAPEVTSGTITLRSQSITTIIPKSSGAAAVDSLKITAVRFCLRNIKFKSTGNDSMNFKTTPILLSVNLAGTVQPLGAIEVPLGTYNRIEFDVHRPQKSTLATPADTVTFADFLKGERYSVIIDGRMYIGGKDSLFSYRSKIDAKQMIDLSPVLTVDKQTPNVNTTMQINTANWFRFGGALLDPMDKNNEGKIDEAIKASIKMK